MKPEAVQWVRRPDMISRKRDAKAKRQSHLLANPDANLEVIKAKLCTQVMKAGTRPKNFLDKKNKQGGSLG